MSMFFIREGAYRSKGPTPSLPACLEAARFAILYQHAVRVEKGGEISPAPANRAVAFLREVRDWLEVPGNDATNLANEIRQSGVVREGRWVPEALRSLATAAAYWFEAEKNARQMDTDRAWSALLQCHYYLGRASGPESHKERSSRAGTAGKRPYDEMRQKLIEWLAELPAKEFKSVGSVVAAIMPKALAFAVEQERSPGVKARVGHATSEGLGKLFVGWTQSDDAIRTAVERAMKNPIQLGAPRKSAPKSAPQAK
ncbi:MAG: hypothetical protein Q8Q73_14275 [Stagnimonas sp.]|nr:hypothetical protein [Stagnimonas sp.]